MAGEKFVLGEELTLAIWKWMNGVSKTVSDSPQIVQRTNVNVYLDAMPLDHLNSSQVQMFIAWINA